MSVEIRPEEHAGIDVLNEFSGDSGPIADLIRQVISPPPYCPAEFRLPDTHPSFAEAAKLREQLLRGIQESDLRVGIALCEANIQTVAALLDGYGPFSMWHVFDGATRRGFVGAVLPNGGVFTALAAGKIHPFLDTTIVSGNEGESLERDQRNARLLLEQGYGAYLACEEAKLEPCVGSGNPLSANGHVLSAFTAAAEFDAKAALAEKAGLPPGRLNAHTFHANMRGVNIPQFLGPQTAKHTDLLMVNINERTQPLFSGGILELSLRRLAARKLSIGIHPLTLDLRAVAQGRLALNVAQVYGPEANATFTIAAYGARDSAFPNRVKQCSNL